MAKNNATPAAPARSELEVAQVVWKLGGATVRQVVDALPDDRKIDFWTAQTYLRRLKAKGYLKTRRDGRADVYLPARRPDRVLRDVVRDFIDRARAYMPDVSIASDFIVGFPTETEEEFQTCVDIIRYSRFKNSFIFKYSPRPGTTAIDRGRGMAKQKFDEMAGDKVREFLGSSSSNSTNS